MDNIIPVNKMLYEFFAAKIIIFAQTLSLQGIKENFREQLVEYSEGFGELSEQITYNYVVDEGHCSGVCFKKDDNEIVTIHFHLNANLICKNISITLGKGFGVESFIYGLLISVFAQRCSGGTGQLYELGTLLDSVDIDFGKLKDIFESELDTSEAIIRNQDYYSNSAELYKYAWYSDLVLLGFRMTIPELNDIYNKYISMSYSFLGRLTGSKRAKYWSHKDKIWVTI